MLQPQESVATIPGDVPLHAVVHGCACAEHPAWGLLFCDPFAEEKKCAHRVLVEAARDFCAADIACMRFDYRGTGDSPGEFGEATPEQWVQDILAAIAFARRELGVRTLGLLGVRLGAALALQAIEASEQADFAILWEPVINGRQYLQQNLRRSMIKAMLTEEEKFDAGRVRQAQAEDVFDFDGYPISAEMRGQIEAIDLLAAPPELPGPALVVNITTREQPAEPYQELAEALGGRAVAVRQEPFWNRIGLIEARPVVEATEIWLAEQQASGLGGR
jgi:exosortase A-associated hydrolase 2